ncbi:MAG: hypothetical protein J6S83_00840 [Lachnospiraceae bacterium]|nr:hypothetical protein [Lachnospiraceae bacterium]
MKKMLTIILILTLILPAAALADIPDISGLSYVELLALQNKLNLAIWSSTEWKRVTVPPGVWKIGEDIPAGKWTIMPGSGIGPNMIHYSPSLDQTGHNVEYVYGKSVIEYVCSASSALNDGTYKNEAYFDLEDGYYIYLGCTVYFTPYSGKPSFNFE